jgi:archaellum component FlaG (FlaF/FlaG flagellin family)
MGFDKIIAWMGVAVILTITLSAFFLIYNNTVADMHEFYKTDKQMLDQYKTGFSIENASYNDSGSIWVYAKNTGKGDIPLQNNKNNECIDVLIDNVWISKANFSANVTNNAYDSLIWNPKEYLNVIVNQNLAAGMHTLTIVECHGLKKTIQFQVTRSQMIYFVPPTEDNWATISRNWTHVNITINAANINTFRFNWNGTNTTVYNDSLMLALNFNNNSAIGENYNNSNGTKIIDISKYGYNGTLYVGANYNGNYTSGRYGGAYKYDGVDDYVDLSAYASTFDDLATGTAMGWFRDRPKTIQVIYYICVSADVGNIASVCLGDCTASYADESFSIGIISGGLGRLIGSVRKGNTYYMDDAWHHFAYVVGTNYNKIYIDGQEQTVSYATGSSATGNYFLNVVNANSFTLARRILTGYDSIYFNGSIDEFRIYNRPLSSQEVLLQYQSELQKYNVSEWRFYANVTNLTEGTYSYYGWASDTLGNSGQTDSGTLRYLIRNTSVLVQFVSPTMSNGTTINRLWAEANITATPADGLDTVKLNWNGTNITFYNNTGPYRRELSIYNPGNALTNYQVKFVFNSSTLDNAADFFSKASNDSIRFVPGVLLYQNLSATVPYWVESWNATAQQAIVWIKIPYLTANAYTPVTMYYGGSGSSLSNGDNTFIFFDDFETNRGWTFSRNPNLYWIGQYSAVTYLSPTNSYEIFYPSATASNPGYYGRITKTLVFDGSQVKTEFSVYDSRNTASPAGYHYKQAYLAGSQLYSLDIAADNMQWDNISAITTPPAGSQDLYLQMYDVLGVFSFGASVFWDNVKIRKYQSPEPSSSIGSESAPSSFYLRIENLSDGTYGYYGWANNSWTKSGQTDNGTTRYITVNPIWLGFVPPTENNGTTIDRNWTEANITIDALRELDSFRFNWNGTNYTFYDDSLIIAMNFNNNSAIGENSTLAVDISKYGHHGTINGTTLSAGKYGSALAFDGIDDCVVTSAFELNGSNLTIELWYKPKEYGQETLFATGQQGVSAGFVMLGISGIPEGELIFQYGNASGTVTQDWVGDYLLGDYTTFVHIAVVAEYSNRMIYYYRNGVQVQITNNSGFNMKFPSDNRVKSVGCWAYTTTHRQQYTNGTIDELRVYNRSLSASEILMHYQSEFSKYNTTQYRFYANITNLSAGNYTYYGWANDTNGNVGRTDDGNLRYIAVNSTLIQFVAPTLGNGSTTSNNWVEANMTFGKPTIIDTLKFSWNGTNITFYNMSGPYKRELLINNTGALIIDYQVRLVFNSSTLDNAADFFSKANESNIRFYPEVLSSANLSSGISHWVEYWNSTTMQATVWIKVPYLLATSNTPVNMYYGGSGANQGNGDATFILFDHFDDASLNTSKWNPPLVTAYFGYVETGSDMIIYTGTRGKTPIYNGENYMNATKSYNMSGTAYDLRVKSTKENADAWYTSLIIGGRLNNGTQYLSFGRHGQSPLKYFSTVGPVDWESGAWDGSLTSYETETLRTFGNNVYYDRNGSLQYTDSKTLTDMQNPYVIMGVGQAITQTAWGEIYVDWAIIRKYTSPEPAPTIGAEISPSQFYVRIENLSDATYGYYGWANTTAAESGQTDYGNTRYITVNTFIYFAPPTENNGTTINRSWTPANVTIKTASLDSFKFNWNGTNYTFYNNSLILAVNFNNNSAIGDSDTKAVDVSKYANNGTISGAIYAPGKYGSGLLLNGVNDYVNFGRPASLDKTSTLSVEAWIKTGDPIGLLLWRENCFMESWRLYVDVSSIRALGSSTGAAWDWIIIGGNVTDNQWHHVAMTFDSAVGMKLYLDGVLNGSDTTTGSLKASGAYDVHLGYITTQITTAQSTS